ncbi:unnamed protein product [Closterium sp. NIES-54]
MSLVLRMSVLLLLLVGSAATARERVAGVVEGAAEVVEVAAVEVAEVVAAVGVVAGVGALVAVAVGAVEVAVVAAMGVVAVGVELFRGEVLAVARGSSSNFGARPLPPSSFHRCFSRLDDAWHAEFGDEAERPHWAELLRSGVAIFDLDYDAILAAMYALSVSAEGDCYLCVPPDPGIEAAALGASESALSDTAPAEALHTLTPYSGASGCFFRDSTTLTPLSAPVPVRMADHSGGLALATSPVSGGSVRLTLRSSPPLVLYELGECRCPPGCDGHYHHSLGSACVDLHVYTDGPSPGNVHPSAWVESVHTDYQASSGSCVCPHVRVRSASTALLMSPFVAPDQSVAPPPWSPLLATPSWHALPPPCFLSSQRAAPHSSFPPTTAPLQTLHMDMWGPSRVSGQDHERYFLLVIDDYTRYTTAFPLRSKGEVLDVLIPWIRAVRLKLRERFREELRVLRLHSDRGGEFSSYLLRDLCRGEGILLSFTLPASPQKNGIAERRIGLVMEVARTSMIHAAAPHFLWPFAVQYAAHQLNLWPRVSLLETSPTLRWMGKVGDASVFRVFGSRAFVRDHSADKLFSRTVPCIFLGFPPDAPGWQFYHPTSRCVLPSSPSGAARGAASRVATSGGAELGGAEPGGVEPRGSEFEGAESGGAEPRGTASAGGHAGALPRMSPRQEPLSPQQLRECC